MHSTLKIHEWNKLSRVVKAFLWLHKTTGKTLIFVTVVCQWDISWSSWHWTLFPPILHIKCRISCECESAASLLTSVGVFSTGSVSCAITGSHVIGVVTQHVELDVLVPVAQQQEQLPGGPPQPGHVQSLRQFLAPQPELCFCCHQFPLHEEPCAAVLQPRQRHGGGPAGALQFLLGQLAAHQEGGRFYCRAFAYVRLRAASAVCLALARRGRNGELQGALLGAVELGRRSDRVSVRRVSPRELSFQHQGGVVGSVVEWRRGWFGEGAGREGKCNVVESRSARRLSRGRQWWSAGGSAAEGGAQAAAVEAIRRSPFQAVQRDLQTVGVDLSQQKRPWGQLQTDLINRQNRDTSKYTYASFVRHTTCAWLTRGR